MDSVIGGVLYRKGPYGESSASPAGAAGVRAVAVVSTVLLLSTALLLAGLESKSFWVDELHSRGLAGADVSSILRDIAGDLHPPLYFVLLHYWSLVAGRGEFALRFLSVAAGLLSLAATYNLGKRLLDARVGMVAALLLGISPFFLLYARMARYYSLTLLLALLSVLVFLRLLRRPSPLNWAASVALGALLIYTDYPAVSVLVTQNVVVLGLWLHRRKPSGSELQSDRFTPSRNPEGERVAHAETRRTRNRVALHNDRKLAGEALSETDGNGFIAPRLPDGGQPYSPSSAYSASPRETSPALTTNFLLRWLLAQAGIFIFYLPWLGTVLKKVATGGAGPGADFARDLFGYIPKLAFPFYSFSVGETLFPWHPAAPLVLLAYAALALIGTWQLIRGRPGRALLLLAFLLIPLLSTTLIVTYVATATTFLNIPSRTMFAYPFFILIVSTGLVGVLKEFSPGRLQTPRRWLGASAPPGLAAIAIFAVGSTISLANYHRGEQVFNPIYVVPTREIVQEIARELKPGDVLLAEVDTGFGYYYREETGSPPFFDADSPEAVQHLLAKRSARVWLTTFGRDSTRTGDATAPALKEILSREYTLQKTRGYVEQDASYRRFKELLLRRPAYQYKLLVELYIRKE